MKYISRIVLVSVELFYAAQAAVFKRYSVINGTQEEGMWPILPYLDKAKCFLACGNDVNCIALNHNEGMYSLMAPDPSAVCNTSKCKKKGVLRFLGGRKQYLTVSTVFPLYNDTHWNTKIVCVDRRRLLKGGTQTCNLLYGQPNALFALTTAEGWDAYFENLKDVDLLSNAVASQSSIFHRWQPIASYAIDGNPSGDFFEFSCSHTAPSGIRWWMVDFQSMFSVSSVILWNRLDIELWYQLRDLRVTVANSLQALNNAYNLCSHYTGPPISAQDNPVRINCSRVMYGRFLKIEKQLPGNEALTLCEVKVIQ